MRSAPAYRSFAPGRISVPAYRGEYAPPGRTSFRGAPQVLGNRAGNGQVRNGSGYGGRRPIYGPDRYRQPYLPGYGYGFGLGYGASGWWDTNYPGFYSDYFDSDLYGSPDDESGYGYVDPGNAAPVDGPPDAAPYYPGGYGPPVEQAQAAPDSSFRPVYQRPQAEPAAEDAVTLVFKDGRPSEQIHNYMLTRTMLYVQGDRLREIAVADLDLPATEKVNREAGVDFRLPDGGQ